MSQPKVAIVHEWFVDHSGSEKVLEQILNVFPQADLFAVVAFLPEDLKYYIHHKSVTTTFIQKLPFAKKHYRNYLPLMPFAVEQLDVSAYDIVISNSHAVSKGVITKNSQLHICYCHSPIRYAWDLYHQYLKESGLDRGIKGLFARLFLHYIRQWDLSTVNRIDYFIANSNYIAQRIGKVYKRKATVIYPPVDTQSFNLFTQKEDFYFTASRFVPYKKIDLIVKAFVKLPDKHLVIIGDGPDFRKVELLAAQSPNISFLGFQPFDVLKSHMQRAKAFVFAADEDFGIMPVEAQACGTPVIAFGRGGSLETVVDGETGIFFQEQSVDAIMQAVQQFEQMAHQFDPVQIQAHAEKFGVARFRKEIQCFIESHFQR